jgi:2,3-diaminopropionate biosynthesis protein SbnA
VPIISTPHETLESATYVDLAPVFGRAVYLKCEGFNFAGSVKIRAAAALVTAAERDGRITPESVLIESSPSNLGLAVAAVATSKGLRFVCVTDPKCDRSTLSLIRALGAEVVVSDVDENDGYLGARLRHVREACAADPRYVWLDQNGNPAGWNAHYETTAPEIAKEFLDLDVLFVGAGTGGTLMGCAWYFRDDNAPVCVVAVDAQGFGRLRWTARSAHDPWPGHSVRPPLVGAGLADDVVHVAEANAVRCCRALARRGFLFGGSTGSVVSGALRWLDEHDPERALRAVALASDLADRYSHTVYDDNWVRDTFRSDALDPTRWTRRTGTETTDGQHPAPLLHHLRRAAAPRVARARARGDRPGRARLPAARRR